MALEGRHRIIDGRQLVIGFSVVFPAIPVGGVGKALAAIVGVNPVVDIPAADRFHLAGTLDGSHLAVAKCLILADIQLIFAIEEGQQIEGVRIEQIQLDGRLHALLLRRDKGTIEGHALEGQIGGILVEIARGSAGGPDQFKAQRAIKGGSGRDDVRHQLIKLHTGHHLTQIVGLAIKPDTQGSQGV